MASWDTTSWDTTSWVHDHARHSKELELDDLSVEVELAEEALKNLARQAAGAGAGKLHARVAFWRADLARVKRRLRARRV